MAVGGKSKKNCGSIYKKINLLLRKIVNSVLGKQDWMQLVLRITVGQILKKITLIWKVAGKVQTLCYTEYDTYSIFIVAVSATFSKITLGVGVKGSLKVV